MDQHSTSQYCTIAHENAWEPRNNTLYVALGNMKCLFQNTLWECNITSDVILRGSNTFPMLDSYFYSFEKHELSALYSVIFLMYTYFIFSYSGLILWKWQSNWNRKSEIHCNILRVNAVNSPPGHFRAENVLDICHCKSNYLKCLMLNCPSGLRSINAYIKQSVLLQFEANVIECIKELRRKQAVNESPFLETGNMECRWKFWFSSPCISSLGWNK